MREKKARVWWVYRYLLCAWTNFDFLASSSAKNEAMGNQTQNKNPISGRKKKRGSEVGEEGGSGCYQRDQGKVWWWEFRWWRIQPRRANSASILSWRKQAMDRTVSFFLHFSLSLSLCVLQPFLLNSTPRSNTVIPVVVPVRSAIALPSNPMGYARPNPIFIII